MAFTNAQPFAGFNIAERLRECIEPFLAGTETGLPARSCSHAASPEGIAWDDCECGQLIVAMTGAHPTIAFPNPWTGDENQGMGKCGPPLFVFNYTVSMLRCAPVMGENGEPPPCDAVTAAARVSIEDAWAVRAGIMCCLCAGVTRDPDTGDKPFERYWVGPQLMTTPAGGCQGSTISLSIGVKNGGYPCEVIS